MREAASIAELRRSPIGRWVVAGSSIAWCADPELCGCVVWGSPGPEDVRNIVAAFESFQHPSFAPRFDVVFDVRRVDVVAPAALAVLVSWIEQHREELARRVRLQIGVISPGIVGITMSGILPVVGATHPFEVTQDVASAMARVGRGDELLDMLEDIVAKVSDTPGWLVELRRLIRAKPRECTLDTLAGRLGRSRRSLQRSLREQATTFQVELDRVRFEVAREALTTTDAKIEVIAHRLDISSRSLVTLVRRFAGCTPSELRTRVTAAVPACTTSSTPSRRSPRTP